MKSKIRQVFLLKLKLPARVLIVLITLFLGRNQQMTFYSIVLLSVMRSVELIK